MRDWSKVKEASITQDRGLLLEFAKAYQSAFNTKLNVGCGMCITDAYKRLKSYKNRIEMKQESKYKLKLKYQGAFWKGRPLQNGSMTEEIAKDLIKNHPKGEGLFAVLPKKEVKEIIEAKEEAPKKVATTKKKKSNK